MDIKGIPFSDQMRMIRGVESIAPKSIEPTPGQVEEGGKASFMDLLVQQMDSANKAGLEADNLIKRAAAGDEVNPHETVIAVQKADISFNLMLSIKDRLEQAYQTLIRTQMG